MPLLSYENAAKEAGKSTAADISIITANLSDIFADGLNLALIAFTCIGIFLIGYGMYMGYQITNDKGGSGKGYGVVFGAVIFGGLLSSITTLHFLIRNSLMAM